MLNVLFSKIRTSLYTDVYLTVVQCVVLLFVVFTILLPVSCMYNFNSSLLLFNPVLLF